ncbi:MAG: lipocalin family protein [Gemmatimonadota bacterium]|nr:lipocalin family protein [Gemmatimonadota bacterium]
MPRLFLISLAAMVLWTCGKDKAAEREPEPHPLVGVWQSSDLDVTGLGNALVSYLTDEMTRNNDENPAAIAENLAAIMTDSINADFNLRIEIKGNGTWVATDGSTGTWKVQSGNTLIMTDVLNASTVATIFTISGQRLSLSIRKAAYINIMKATGDQEAQEIFEAILSGTAETAEVMQWRFTKVS